jgi:hypothetical protein
MSKARNTDAEEEERWWAVWMGWKDVGVNSGLSLANGLANVPGNGDGASTRR